MINIKSNNKGLTSFPPQRISDSAKTEDWGKQCVDAIQGMSSRQGRNGRSPKVRKQKNYDLYNSIIDPSEVSHVLDPSDIASQYGEMPGRMQCYNKIRGDIQALLGEETLRPFNFMVVGEGGEVISAREEVKKNAVFQNLVSRLLAELGLAEPEIDQTTGQPILPEAAAKYAERSYKDIREITANQLLDALMKRENLQSKFAEGFEHAFISSEEIYYIGISGGHPRVRVVNPLYFDFDKDPELKFVQDGQWAKEERWMTMGSVLDEYGEFLTDTELDRLEAGELNLNGNSGWGFGYGAVGGLESLNNEGHITSVNDLGGMFGYNMDGVSSSHIYVCDVVWKSQQKVGFIKYVDDFGKPQMETVDGDYKLTREQKSAGWEISYQWANQIYRGTKIGGDIYVNVVPLPNQIDGKLPYVGYIYNNLNSVAMSLVDLLKPHQYLYNILWYRMEVEIAKSGGSVMVMDLAKLPKTQGMTIDQFMYYLKSHGIAFINSAEEISPGVPSNANNFITSLDLAMSQTISQYLLILAQLEELMSDLSGVSRQRKGQITSSETVGGVERAIVNSSNTTQPYFFKHNEVKKVVLEQLLACAQIAYIEGTTLQNVVDEVYTEIIKIDGALFNDSTFRLHVSNSSKDQQIKEKIEAQAQAAAQNGLLKFSDIVTVIKSSSIAEISSIVRESEIEKSKQDQANLDADRQAQVQVQETQLQAQREQREFEMIENQKDRNSKEYIASLTASAIDKGEDVDQNNQADFVGQMKVALDSKKANDQIAIESTKLQQQQQKLQLEANKQQSDALLKQRELDIKQEDSRNKVKIAVQNKNKYSK